MVERELNLSTFVYFQLRFYFLAVFFLGECLVVQLVAVEDVTQLLVFAIVGAAADFVEQRLIFLVVTIGDHIEVLPTDALLLLPREVHPALPDVSMAVHLF